MVTSYATELAGTKAQKGERTNKFVMTKDGAKNASREVLATHFAMNAAEQDEFLANNFESAWNYWDVNGAGAIDTVGVATFFRYLTKKLGSLDL